MLSSRMMSQDGLKSESEVEVAKEYMTGEEMITGIEIEEAGMMNGIEEEVPV